MPTLWKPWSPTASHCFNCGEPAISEGGRDDYENDLTVPVGKRIHVDLLPEHYVNYLTSTVLHENHFPCPMARTPQFLRFHIQNVNVTQWLEQWPSLRHACDLLTKRTQWRKLQKCPTATALYNPTRLIHVLYDGGSDLALNFSPVAIIRDLCTGYLTSSTTG